MINIDCIPHTDQRYPTVGDWVFRGPNLYIYVSDTGNQDYNYLIGLHELVEAYMCKHMKIPGKVVDEWDKSHLGNMEPGDIPECPYFWPHKLATWVEVCIAHSLGVDWKEYGDAIEALFQ